MEKINIKDARIASALKNSMPELYDGVFIMFHLKSDNIPLMVNPHKWPSYQSNGEIAEGVVIVEGDKILVVAPTESSLYWSGAAVSGGGTTTFERLVALSDWNGRMSTTSQILKAECNSENFAAGFCNKYSRVNANGQGLTAGKWWLPSLGEMIMIFTNLMKVNYALSLINGSVQIAEDRYWTSTEADSLNAWFMLLNHGSIFAFNKLSSKFKVRPVSAFIV